LTVSFDGTGSFDPDGVIVDYEWDFDGDGLFNEAGDEAAAQGSPTASSTYTTYGTFNPSLRVTDDGGATDTDTVGILVLSPPVADLQASPTSGGIPLLVSFDATGSYDPDGIIVDYEWDLDGDGIFNEAGIEAMSQGSATTSYGYASPGTFLATVRVTDNDALTDTDSVTISVNPSGWTITAPNPDDNGMTGMHSSLAIINGNPAISYYDFNGNDGNLMYVRATDASGTAWGVPEVVDSTGDVGLWCSLAEVNGHAAISYYDGTNGHLVYTYWDGATWQRITVEDESFIPAGSRSGAGQYSSLAVVSGQPAIAYFHATIGRLMFWRASDVDGSTWPTLMRESVDWPTSADPYSKGMDTSLKIVSGNPAISYYHTRGYLKYARAADAAGSDWTTGGGGIVVTVDGSRKTGMYTSLEVVNGQPAISYYRLYEIVFPIGTQYRRDLRYVRASDATGSAWGAPLTVDDGGMADDNVGMYCSMTVVDGNPAIAYQDTTHGYLCYIRATNNTGSAWGFRELLDTSGFVGAYACMKIVNGEPAVSYHDASNGSLKYIRKNP